MLSDSCFQRALELSCLIQEMKLLFKGNFIIFVYFNLNRPNGKKEKELEQRMEEKNQTN